MVFASLKHGMTTETTAFLAVGHGKWRANVRGVFHSSPSHAGPDRQSPRTQAAQVSESSTTHVTHCARLLAMGPRWQGGGMATFAIVGALPPGSPHLAVASAPCAQRPAVIGRSPSLALLGGPGAPARLSLLSV